MGGVKGRKITRKRERYVRTGVAVVSIDIDIDIRISIINNNPERLVCLLCLLRVVRYTVLRCAAGKITIDPKAHLPY